MEIRQVDPADHFPRHTASQQLTNLSERQPWQPLHHLRWIAIAERAQKIGLHTATVKESLID
jgi:hypothetical protein